MSWFLQAVAFQCGRLGENGWRNQLRKEPCSYCGRWPNRQSGRRAHGRGTCDHIVAKSEGGHNGWENRAAACINCNVQKGALPAIVFLVQRGGMVPPLTRRQRKELRKMAHAQAR